MATPKNYYFCSMPTPKNKLTPEQLELYKDEYSKAHSAADYAIRRIDYIIISVSMAGIFLNFQVIKWLTEKCIHTCTTIYFWSIGLFVLCVIFNLIGQKFSFTAHENIKLYYRDQLIADAGINMENQAKELNPAYYNLINWSNGISLFSVILGIILSFVGLLFS